MDRKEQKQEAIDRMRKIGIMDRVIEDFEKKDLLYKSEFAGLLYYLDDSEKALVKEYEEESGALVYHVEKSYTNIGTMLNLLYVSKYKDDWEFDRREMIPDSEGDIYLIARVINLDCDIKESGTIVIRPVNGGIKRRF